MYVVVPLLEVTVTWAVAGVTKAATASAVRATTSKFRFVTFESSGKKGDARRGLTEEWPQPPCRPGRQVFADYGPEGGPRRATSSDREVCSRVRRAGSAAAHPAGSAAAS